MLVSSRLTSGRGRIIGARVDCQHIFHRSNKGGIGFRRDHPIAALVRFERVFLSPRWIVLSLALSTMPNLTTRFSRRRKEQRATRRWFRTGQCNELRLSGSIKDWGRGRGLLLFTGQRRFKAFFHKLAAGAVYCGNTGIQSFRNPLAIPAATVRRYISLEHSIRRLTARADHILKPQPFISIQSNNILHNRATF